MVEFLRDDERELLASGFIEFTVDRPVTVYVARSIFEDGDIFWLEDNGFTLTDLAVFAGRRKHLVWQRSFETGPVGLGINTFLQNQDPVFYIVTAKNGRGKPVISDISPAYVSLAEAQAGGLAYADDLMEINEVPESLIGQVLIQPKRWDRNHVRLVGFFRQTKYPSGPLPDQVILTWSEDPRTTQTIQWRTDATVTVGRVAYSPKSEYDNFHRGEPREVTAASRVLKTVDVVNDPINIRHTAVLRGLKPDSIYYYSVGDGSPDGWTELAEFRTAPASPRPFAFIYMGDVQNGMDSWNSLIAEAFHSRPDARFYVFAGDLVSRGVDRDDWDDFFFNGREIFRQRQIVPVIGNHEGQGKDRHPTMFLELFDLPDDGPDGVEPERAYSLEYSNFIIAVLDSMLPGAAQSGWLDHLYASSEATWNFATFHFPLYSSNPERNYREIRESWLPVIDKHHVDMVLQGHDHVYMRTGPLKNSQRVASASEGTYYTITYAGTKSGNDPVNPLAEVLLDKVSSYQVIDVRFAPDRLVYRAYDVNGKQLDMISIEK